MSSSSGSSNCAYPHALFCRQAGIVDEGTCSLREIEETFVWANKENGADLQDKLAGQLGSAAALASAALAAGINDDSSLMRYEFLLALVRQQVGSKAPPLGGVESRGGGPATRQPRPHLLGQARRVLSCATLSGPPEPLRSAMRAGSATAGLSRTPQMSRRHGGCLYTPR